MTKKTLNHIFIISLYILVLIYFPVKYNTLTPNQIYFVIISLLVSALTGSALLLFSKVLKEGLAFWGLSFIIGNIFLWLLSLIIPDSFFLHLVIITGTISGILLYNKRQMIINIEFNIPIISIIISFIIILLYLQVSDYYQAISSLPFQAVNSLPDPFFFTLVTHSLTVSSPLNAIYDIGAPINYQIFSFIPPAVLSKLTNIPSQISLWGIWMPFYKFTGVVLLSIGIITQINKNIRTKWWSLPLIIILIFSLAPVNPKYILNFNLSKIVFLGTGYLLPGGNPPFTFAMILMGAVLIIFKKKNWFLYDGILFILFLSMIIGSKTALFIPFAIYIGIHSLLNYKECKSSFFYVISTIIPSIIIYIILFGNSYGMIKIYYQPGFYIEHFNHLFGSNTILLGVIYMTITLLLFGGVRFLILTLSIFYNKDKNRNEFYAITISFIVTLLIPLFFRFKLLSPNGSILQDVSFDLIQFVRAAFFVITISSIIALLSLKIINIKIKKVLISTLVLYSIVTLSSNISRMNNSSKKTEDSKWRNEVRNEINSVDNNNNNTFAIYGNKKYSGQLIAAEGLGKWWYTCKRGDGSGYILTNKNYYRNEIMDSIIHKLNPLKQFKKLNTENVDYIIANPNNIELFNNYKKQEYIFKNKKFNWLFSIKRN